MVVGRIISILSVDDSMLKLRARMAGLVCAISCSGNSLGLNPEIWRYYVRPV